MKRVAAFGGMRSGSGRSAAKRASAASRSSSSNISMDGMGAVGARARTNERVEARQRLGFLVGLEELA